MHGNAVKIDGKQIHNVNMYINFSAVKAEAVTSQMSRPKTARTGTTQD